VGLKASVGERRIGLFGGSFDPVHNAHLALAESAHAQMQLDAVWFIPTGHSWQKSRPLAAAEHRLQMLTLATATLGSWAAIDPIETLRSGPSYTIDTLNALDAREGPQAWFWLMGTDQLNNFCTWAGWQQLAARMTLAVAARPGAQWQLPEPLKAAAPRIETVRMAPLAVSATEIRSRCAAGRPLDGLVPPGVAQYIAENRLYAD
jgi:nicotinate-nucleotide adenylyltransferase